MALETLEQRIEKLEDYQQEGLRWISNMAAHLVKMDHRIELMEETQRDIRDILQELRAVRQNGTAQ